ncbi:hypothetical protein [Alteromonas sp. CYL-A6]|uniref:hypothetical protein n=1 Tax=Alteromonas nitratireducens TaxID=3390813 RepID=UPI0034B36497
MKQKMVMGLAAIAVAAVLNIAAAKTQDNGDYMIHAYKHCQPVASVAMNHDLILAYQDLSEAGESMAELEVPIDGIQAELARYSEDIERITREAVIEQGDRVIINNALLEEQQHLAQKIEALVAQHESDFAALEEQGERISDIAREFEQGVDALLDGVDYDNIRIQTPEHTSGWHCDIADAQASG